MHLSDVQLAAVLGGAPFLILSAVWLVWLLLAFKPARVRSVRVVAKRERV